MKRGQLSLTQHRHVVVSIALLGLMVGEVSLAGTPGEWTGTWYAPPVMASTLTFNDQTIREIVHISIPGTRIRVRLTNLFGTGLLPIGEAHVAIRASGSSIVPGTDRALTFGGATSVNIPAGAPMLSDPVDLETRIFDDVAVSIYFPTDTGGSTVHGTGVQTSYISGPGDYTADEQFPEAMTTTSRYFLAGVEVTPTVPYRAVVTLGDSITDGTRSTPDTNNRWPDHLAVRLYENQQTMAMLNAGISGNRILRDGAGPNAPARFDRDVLVQQGVTHVTLLESINDIGQNCLNPDQGVTVDQLMVGIRQLIARAHEKHLKFIGATMTPFEGAAYFCESGEVQREAINDWIRFGGEVDGVIDFDAAVRDPANPRRFLPFFDSGDHLHPNDYGYTVMAESIDLSLFQ
jgi:lysophospholipase L1-like esterase